MPLSRFLFVVEFSAGSGVSIRKQEQPQIFLFSLILFEEIETTKKNHNKKKIRCAYLK